MVVWFRYRDTEVVFNRSLTSKPSPTASALYHVELYKHPQVAEKEIQLMFLKDRSPLSLLEGVLGELRPLYGGCFPLQLGERAQCPRFSPNSAYCSTGNQIGGVLQEKA